LTCGAYCPRHARERAARYDADRGEGRQWYAQRRWRALRRQVLRARPVCEGCDEAASEEVHHLVPRRERPELAFELSNLQALCKSCHSRATLAASRAGGGGAKIWGGRAR
jgi:5-methylcytosine-specific restriction protein A